MQIYLPEELYAELKRRKLPASELLQTAVRAEIRRLELADAADEYLQELIAEVGEPSPEELAWAEDFVARLKAHNAKSSKPETTTKTPASKAARPSRKAS